MYFTFAILVHALFSKVSCGNTRVWNGNMNTQFKILLIVDKICIFVHFIKEFQGKNGCSSLATTKKMQIILECQFYANSLSYVLFLPIWRIGLLLMICCLSNRALECECKTSILHSTCIQKLLISARNAWFSENISYIIAQLNLFFS